MAEIKCRCGGYATYQIGDVEHYMNSRKIILKNVPHYYCSSCDIASYGDNVHVTALLRYACTEKLSEMEYKSIKIEEIGASIVPPNNTERDQIRMDMQKMIADYKQNEN